MKSYTKIVFLLVAVLFSFSSNAKIWYVDDSSNTGDIYTPVSASGSDASAGTALAPFAGLLKAINSASSGDTIYVDNGNYSEFGIQVNKNDLKIFGAGMTKTIFTSNNNKGYCIDIKASNIFISDIKISKYGYGSGGSDLGQAMTIGNGSSVLSGIVINNVNFENNGGGAGETAIFVKSKTDCKFIGGGSSCNSSSTYAGGCTISGSNINVLFENYVFTFNGGDSFGGVAGGSIKMLNGNSTQHLVVKNTLFDGNQASSSTFNGMDIYVETGDVKVFDCVFNGSKSAFAAGTAIGGSIYIKSSTNSDVYIENSKFTNNSCTGNMNGSAIGIDGGNLILSSCYFSGNIASGANDVFCRSGSIIASNCIWTEIGQKNGLFEITNCGDPTVASGSITKINTVVPNFTLSPLVPSFSGSCGLGLIITPPCTPPIASFVTSPASSSCSSTNVVYTTQSGMTNYTWSVPGTINVDYEITSGGIGSTDNTVTLKWLTSGDKTVTVGYKSGACVTTTSATSTTNVVLSPSISNTTSTSQSFCASPIPTVANLSPASTPVLDIKWYANLQGGSFLNDNTALVNGNKYYASAILTSSPACESIERYEVTVAINASLVASFVTSPATSSCSSTNVVYTTQIGMTDYTWSVPGTINVDYEITSGGIGSTDNTVTLKWLTSGDKTVTVGYKSGTCVTTTSATSTTNVVISPSISNTTSTSQSFCASPIPTVANLSPASTPALDIKWYANLQGGSFLNDNTALVNGNKYYASAILTSSPACESVERYEVTVAINASLVASFVTSPATSSCSSTNVVYTTETGMTDYTWSVPGTINVDYEITSGGIGSTDNTVTLKWLTSGDKTVTVGYKSGTCVTTTSATSTTNVVISPSISNTTSTSQSFCAFPISTVSNLSPASIPALDIKWYANLQGGSFLNDNTALVNGNKYYASAILTSSPACESIERYEVTVTLNDPAKPTTTNTSQSFCLIEAKKVSDLSATGTNLTWYDAPTSGTAYSSSALLSSGTYYASQKVATCESKNRLEVVVKISNPSNAPTGDFKQYFCMNSNPKVSDLDASGTTIKWYNSISGGVEFITTDALTDKTHYFATQTKNGECESVSRFDVFVNLSNVSLALDSQVKAHCGKSDGIITVIAKDGIGNYKYSWDNQVSNSNILTNAGIGQFVANVIDSVGCKSSLSIEELCESIVPQVITADGNGKNDTWVLNLEAKANLKIFNRWGSLVFTASPYMDDWNGQNNEGVTLGKGSLPSGTYFYTIDKKDGEKPLTGFIELVR